MKNILRPLKVITWDLNLLEQSSPRILYISALAPSQDWWRWTCILVAQMKSGSFLLCGEKTRGGIPNPRKRFKVSAEVNWSLSTVNFLPLDRDLTVQRVDWLCFLTRSYGCFTGVKNLPTMCYPFCILINTLAHWGAVKLHVEEVVGSLANRQRIGASKC